MKGKARSGNSSTTPGHQHRQYNQRQGDAQCADPANIVDPLPHAEATNVSLDFAVPAGFRESARPKPCACNTSILKTAE
jgi:hypothetical protein